MAGINATAPPRPYLILAIAWLGWMFDIMDTALFNFAKGPMLIEMLGGKDAYKLHGPEIEGRIQALFLVGWAVGGLGFSILADRWGRSRTLIVTILAYSLLTGLTALCRTPNEVAVVRFLTGLGIGGEWAAGAALVAEAFSLQARGPAAALLQSAAAFGPWSAAAINLVNPPGSWRTLFLVGILPALVCVAIRFYVQEPAAPAALKGDWRSPLRGLFGKPRWRRNAWIAMVMGTVGVTGAGLVPFWLPNLVRQATEGVSPEALRNFTSYNTFTIHIGTLLGVIAFPWLANRFGRRPTFAAFFVLAPIAITAALYGAPSFERLLILLPVSMFFAIGVSAGFVLYFPELFPRQFRATGAGLGYNVGRIASAPMPALVGSLIGAFSGNVAIIVMLAAGLYVFGLAALAFAPETLGQELPEDTEI